MLLPYIIPDVVRALAWRVLLDPLFGALNFILVGLLHVPRLGRLRADLLEGVRLASGLLRRRCRP